MINVNQWFKSGVDALTDNAPAILTAFGAVGVVATAVLTGKATFIAAEQIRDAQIDRNIDEGVISPLTKTEKFKIVWPLYIGATTSGVISIAAIVMSNRISSRRAAVMAAAYALNQEKLEEYQDKVKEKLGIKKEAAIEDEIAQDRVNRDYNAESAIFSPLDGKVLIMEGYTGRFFWDTVEHVKASVNAANSDIVREGSVRISDLYDYIKNPQLGHVDTSDYFGFTREDPIALDWSTCTTPDGRHAVHAFRYVNHPVMNPEREARPFR